jgi:CRP-like cAMP-binding protein
MVLPKKRSIMASSSELRTMSEIRMCTASQSARLRPRSSRSFNSGDLVERGQSILDKPALLASHEFFRDMPPTVVEQLAIHARSTNVPSGHYIFRKGDEGLGLLAVVSGIVKVSVPSPDGKEIVLNIIGAGEIFGEIALLDGEPRTADAVAATRCQLLFLDRRDFLRVLHAQPFLAIKLLAVVSGRLRRTSGQVEDIAFATAPARIAKALFRLAEIQGTINGETPRIVVTQKELGQTVGLSRESTNKCLRTWEKAGYIHLEKGGCTIRNRQLLHNALSEPHPR